MASAKASAEVVEQALEVAGEDLQDSVAAAEEVVDHQDQEEVAVAGILQTEQDEVLPPGVPPSWLPRRGDRFEQIE